MHLPLLLPYTAALATTLLAAPPALAATGGDTTPLNLPATDAQAAASSGGGGGIVRTFVGLAIVLAVIYGLYWVLKQVKASRETAASGQGLQSVASVPLGPGRSMHLVRTGRELILVGVSEHSVVPIRSYGEAEAQAAGLLGQPSFEDDAPTAPPSASQALRDLLDRVQRKTVRG
jgi:flagellar protein FliO/FliZ